MPLLLVDLYPVQQNKRGKCIKKEFMIKNTSSIKNGGV